MQKTDRYYLQNMLAYALKLKALAERTSRADYDSDETRQASYRYWLQVIGDAARHVSLALKEAHPRVNWLPILWKTVHNRIPELVEQSGSFWHRCLMKLNSPISLEGASYHA